MTRARGQFGFKLPGWLSRCEASTSSLSAMSCGVTPVDPLGCDDQFVRLGERLEGFRVA